MKNNGMGLVWIVVADLDKAIKYYTEVLGMEVSSIAKEFGWAELKSGDGAVLGLAQENPEFDMKAGSNAVMTMKVDNLDESKAELAEKGVSLLGEVQDIPGHCRLQLCADEDGNLFQLVQLLDA